MTNMNLLSIFSDIKETDTLYVLISFVAILLFWGLSKIGRKKK